MRIESLSITPSRGGRDARGPRSTCTRRPTAGTWRWRSGTATRSSRGSSSSTPRSRRDLTAHIPNAKLWSPDTPHLYDLRVRLRHDGDVLDEVDSYAGLRQRGTARRMAAPERRADLPGDGAGPGLLAAELPGRPLGRGPAGGRGMGQDVGLQRRPQAPEDRGPALALLVRPAGPAGLGGDAERPRLVVGGRGAPGRRVGAGGAPRLQPPLHHRLGAGQREHGVPRPAKRAIPASTPSWSASSRSPAGSTRSGP